MSFDQDLNLYGVSEVIELRTTSGDFNANQFYVESDLILCGKVVLLPKVCVVTGSREDLVMLKKRLVYFPALCYVGLLGGLLLFLILYLIFRKQCSANYYVTREVRKKKVWRILLGILCILLGPFLAIAGASMGDPPVIFAAPGIVTVVVGLVLIVMGSAPLTIARHQNGVRFWLKGAKPEFFEELRLMYQS